MSALAERLCDALGADPAAPPLEGDYPELRARATARAAVLIALTDRQEPGLILTVRREHLRTHAGQIAFPGGRIDPGEEPIAAALREAREELLVDPSTVEVVGTTDPYRTVSGYVITPVVGVVSADLRLEAQANEVADWFEAPLHHMLDQSNHRRQSAVFDGRERQYYEIIWNERRIWGATAAMIVNLSRRLQWS